MLFRRRKGWEIAEKEAIPERIFFGRRDFLKAAVAFPLSGRLGALCTRRFVFRSHPSLLARPAQ